MGGRRIMNGERNKVTCGRWRIMRILRIMGLNYGKIKNQTNFERAKMYEDVDHFA